MQQPHLAITVDGREILNKPIGESIQSPDALTDEVLQKIREGKPSTTFDPIQASLPGLIGCAALMSLVARKPNVAIDITTRDDGGTIDIALS